MSPQEFRALHGLPPPGSDGPVKTASKPQIRLAPKRKRPQTEIEYERILKMEFPDCQILIEPFRFNLPSGTFYKVDLVVMDCATIKLAVEVKGPKILNTHSVLHFKEARATYPHWKWRFAQKDKQGNWSIAE